MVENYIDFIFLLLFNFCLVVKGIDIFVVLILLLEGVGGVGGFEIIIIIIYWNMKKW